MIEGECLFRRRDGLRPYSDTYATHLTAKRSSANTPRMCSRSWRGGCDLCWRYQRYSPVQLACLQSCRRDDQTSEFPTSATDQIPRQKSSAHPTVTTCYSLLDFNPAGGVSDYTDGINETKGLCNDRAARSIARRSICSTRFAASPSSRILDIGCGKGRLLQ